MFFNFLQCSPTKITEYRKYWTITSPIANQAYPDALVVVARSMSADDIVSSTAINSAVTADSEAVSKYHSIRSATDAYLEFFSSQKCTLPRCNKRSVCMSDE